MLNLLVLFLLHVLLQKVVLEREEKDVLEDLEKLEEKYKCINK